MKLAGGKLAGTFSFQGKDRSWDIATPDTAIPLVTGDGPIGKRAGQALVRREAAGWRVDDEILESAPE